MPRHPIIGRRGSVSKEESMHEIILHRHDGYQITYLRGPLRAELEQVMTRH